MNILLIFFALPVAVIIFSIILQKISKCPIIVASIIFAIFLVITFVINNLNFLIATIVYTFLAFITAFIVMLLCRINNFICCNTNRCGNRCSCNNRCNCDDRCNCNDRCDCNNGCNCNDVRNSNNISTTNIDEQNLAVTDGSFNIGRNGTVCTCNQIDNNTISVSANIVPNNNRNGRFFGTYRRCR